MKTTLALLLAATTCFAAPMSAQIVEQFPTGCIDYEYYSDLGYYEDFQVLKYSESNPDLREGFGTQEWIQDKKGNKYIATYGDYEVCIKKTR